MLLHFVTLYFLLSPRLPHDEDQLEMNIEHHTAKTRLHHLLTLYILFLLNVSNFVDLK